MIEPIAILLMQTLIAAAGVLISYWVANSQGEMAATKYNLNETRRREHALMLVGEPLNDLKGRISYHSYIINIHVDPKTGDINLHRMNIHDRVSPEQELLNEHLKTGYPELLQTICRYQDSYNEIIDRVLATYRRGTDFLVKKWEAKNLLSVQPSPKIYCAMIINLFSREVGNRLFQKHEPIRIQVVNIKDIQIGSTLVNCMNHSDAKIIEEDLNLILEGSKGYGELQKIWEEAKFLHEEREKIDNQLNRLRVFIREGISLQGSCPAGREANYEN